MTKTQYNNTKSRQAINRLELPDYQARYDRLEAVARLHGRHSFLDDIDMNLLSITMDNFATDMEMLKV